MVDPMTAAQTKGLDNAAKIIKTDLELQRVQKYLTALVVEHNGLLNKARAKTATATDRARCLKAARSVAPIIQKLATIRGDLIRASKVAKGAK